MDEGIRNIELLDMESDWYNESDTSSDFPEPNEQKEALFQDLDVLPVLLAKCRALFDFSAKKVEKWLHVIDAL